MKSTFFTCPTQIIAFSKGLIQSPFDSLFNCSFKTVRTIIETVACRMMLVLLLSLCCSLVFAQPEPCGPVPDMTSTCIQACVICDIDGYVGINDDPQSGQEPPGFCTGTAHHMQWIAFIAGSTNLTITVTPSNCDQGDGLEVGIYYSLNCNTLQLVSNCDGDIQEGQVGVFSNTVPLIIGQYYYFVMDGNMSDICQYVINVTSGTTLVPPLPDAGPIQGATSMCQFETETYSIPAIPGATAYRWTLDGNLSGNGISNEISFPQPGVYELCVEAYNVCDTADPACQIITVHPASVTEDSVGLCEGDCLVLGDTTICDPGLYILQLTNSFGCDSIVNLTVSSLSFTEMDMAVTICTTDSFQLNGTWYSLPGQYDIMLTSTSGCDSIIHLDLQSIVCEFDGQLDAVPVMCAGDFTGDLVLQVSTGAPPFTFAWQHSGDGLSGSGTVSALNTPERITNLPAGTYFVTVTDLFGNDLIVSASISEPPSLSVELTAVDYNGFNITCHGSMDGQVMAFAQGGTPPYHYTWSTGDTLTQVVNLAPQTYNLTITDFAGCETIDTITLTEPSPLNLDVSYIDPSCTGPNTGVIEVVGMPGGAPPYQYTITGGDTNSTGLFLSLPEGLYTVSCYDANGCSNSSTAVLTGSIIPHLEAGEDIEIELGYSTPLSGIVDIPDAMVEWTPSVHLSCTFCLDPVASPFVTTVYTLTGISSDGCVSMDSLTVHVRKSDAAVYVPNAFSPNDDGINDYLTVYGNRAVKQIDKLSIFSRWGDLVFEENVFMPNDALRGWDGTFHNKPVQTGVFTWIAEVRFLDDAVSRYSGDITLIR